MWLRTSANNPHFNFDSFLCYGEGVFADCVDWVGIDEKWPGGEEDDLATDLDDEEEQIENPIYLQHMEKEWEKIGNSDPMTFKQSF